MKTPYMYSPGPKKQSLESLLENIEKLSLGENLENSVFFLSGPENILLDFFSLMVFLHGGKIYDGQALDLILTQHKDNALMDVQENFLFGETHPWGFCFLEKDSQIKDLLRIINYWPKTSPLFLGSTSFQKYTQGLEKNNVFSFYGLSSFSWKSILIYGTKHWPTDFSIAHIPSFKAQDIPQGSWLSLLKIMDLHHEEELSGNFLGSFFPHVPQDDPVVFFQRTKKNISTFYPQDPLKIIKIWQLWVWQLTQYRLLWEEHKENSEKIFSAIEPEVFFKYHSFIKNFGQKCTLELLHRWAEELLFLEEDIKINKTDGVLLLKNFLLKIS